MTNDGILDSDEFCNVIQMVNSISKISDDYWTEFVLYLTVIFPTKHTKLYLKDFMSIRGFLSSINRDEDKIIENIMIQQVLISQAGETFFKEYQFYTDPKNFINNSDFINKKNYLINKYEGLKIKITQIIDL
jgi:lipopolysaccharide biosynthesis protein